MQPPAIFIMKACFYTLKSVRIWQVFFKASELLTNEAYFNGFAISGRSRRIFTAALVRMKFSDLSVARVLKHVYEGFVLFVLFKTYLLRTARPNEYCIMLRISPPGFVLALHVQG